MTSEPEAHVLLALARLVMDVSVRASEDVGGVSPVQLRALTALREMGEANLVTLAEEMGVAVSTASRLVDRLVSADWVTRAPSTSNRREISLALSASGTGLLQRYDERRVELLRHRLEHVPADRLAAVADALGEIARVAPV